MTSFAPEVPIRVDPETGIWTTDGLPMIYLPRHFYVNHHDAYARALGREAHARLLYDAGYKSAWQWCEKDSVKHALRGTDVFRHYMKRISQRGWGQFTVEKLDERTGEGRVRLDHSVYVPGQFQKAGAGLCYAFAGWFPGALEWAARDIGADWALTASEVQCAGDGHHDHCAFEIIRREVA
jgi:predicted hydrocarbon binding protein